MIIDLDFSDADPNKIELLPAGFAELEQRGRLGLVTALGGFGWPQDAPRVWFVVCADEGKMHEPTHLAVCCDEEMAHAATEQIAKAFSDAGAALIRRPA